LHHEEVALEVGDVERNYGFADATRLFVELGRQLPWLTASLAAWCPDQPCRRRSGGSCP
jgi:hypothetical protein